MTDREAFEACPDLQDYCDFSRCPDGTQRGIVVYNDPWTQGAWQGWQAALASERAQQAEPVASDNYIQPVPDHCDRITWRGQYFHLPLATPPAVKGEPQVCDHRWVEKWEYDVGDVSYCWKCGKGRAEVLRQETLAAPPAVQGKTQGYTISRDEEWNLVVTEGTYEDDEAVRLLREARKMIDKLKVFGNDNVHKYDVPPFCAAIDAYLAKVGK